jgi:hypothetical protein
MAMITVLYDSRACRVLGRKGRWVTMAEFERDPPQRAEDLIPEGAGEGESHPDPDPGPTYKCINHVLHVCSGTTCFRLGTPC